MDHLNYKNLPNQFSFNLWKLISYTSIKESLFDFKKRDHNNILGEQYDHQRYTVKHLSWGIDAERANDQLAVDYFCRNVPYQTFDRVVNMLKITIKITTFDSITIYMVYIRSSLIHHVCFQIHLLDLILKNFFSDATL